MSEQVAVVKDQIRQFILEAAQGKGVTAVTDDESLVKNGFMDSLAFFRLVGFLEDTFSVQVADHEMLVENFQSIDAIDRYVTAKLQKMD